MPDDATADDAAARARAWLHAQHEAVCDVVEPWAHGTLLRATRHPNYYAFNLVRVEEQPLMGVDELAKIADGALAGLSHRCIDFDDARHADRLRAEFEASGWEATRLLWMRHEDPPPPGPAIQVEEVPYEAVRELRAAWHREDFPGVDPTDFLDQAREVAESRNVQVLAVSEEGRLVAYAQLERPGDGAEISQVYVHPEYRGGGRGTAMTRAAIEAADSVRDLWITADDDDRPKELYGRLGFRTAWTSMELLLLPGRGSAES